MPNQTVETASERMTYAVGDVHGCLDKLTRLLGFCTRHADGRPMRLVFVGDYIDRGPDSRGVIATLRALQHDNPEVICLRGNHEALLTKSVATGDATHWMRNGGPETLASYGVRDVAHIPADDLAWIAALPASFDDGRRFFAHAGINPEFPLDRQSDHDLAWIREPFLSSDRDFGRLIVHGHTPVKGGPPEMRRNRINLDTGAVYGGPLTAAVFTTATTPAIALVNDSLGVHEPPIIPG